MIEIFISSSNVHKSINQEIRKFLQSHIGYIENFRIKEDGDVFCFTLPYVHTFQFNAFGFTLNFISELADFVPNIKVLIRQIHKPIVLKNDFIALSILKTFKTRSSEVYNKVLKNNPTIEFVFINKYSRTEDSAHNSITTWIEFRDPKSNLIQTIDKAKIHYNDKDCILFLMKTKIKTFQRFLTFDRIKKAFKFAERYDYLNSREKRIGFSYEMRSKKDSFKLTMAQLDWIFGKDCDVACPIFYHSKLNHK